MGFSISSLLSRSNSVIANTCKSIGNTLMRTIVDITKLEMYSFLELEASRIAQKVFLEHNVCLPELLKSQPQIAQSLRQIAIQMQSLKAFTCGVFDANSSSAICKISDSAIEELLCRYVGQEIVLRKLPEAIIRKISPQHASIVDSLPCKISRVVLSTLFFTFLHQGKIFLKCENQLMTALLVYALSYSLLQEYTGSLTSTLYLHIRHNLGLG